MKNQHKHAAINAAQMLIDANLSPLGRDMSIQIAAHLQFVEGYFRDYRNALVDAVATIDVAETLPLLMGEAWTKLSRSQQRQWVGMVEAEMRATVTFVQNFQRALSAQATMIEQVESMRVEAATAKLAKLEPGNALLEPTDDVPQLADV